MSFTNTAPFEVIAAPYRLYWAPVATVFPAITDLESAFAAAGWTLIGSNGDLNYDRGEAVTLEHGQVIVEWRSVGDAGTRKVFRTEESQKVRIKLVDITLEQYRHALNLNTVTISATNRKIGLSRGFAVATHALLIRSDVSPYGDGLSSQYEIPRAAQIGNPTVTHAKQGEPAGLMLEWSALVDPTASSEDERFGRLVCEAS